MPKLTVFVAPRSAHEVARISAHAMNAPLDRDAALWVSTIESDAVLLGAFQRANEVDAGAPLFRRASGGPAIAIAPGAIHLALALRNPGALTPCDAPRLVNRYVRPLLGALSTFGKKAAYFGRDWVSVEHRPVAWVGFAHDASTKRAVVEAVVGVRAHWSIDRNRASFLGKSEITLEEALAHSIDVTRVAEAIAEAYEKKFDGERSDPLEIDASFLGDEPSLDEPEWVASIDEAIGIVTAGRDRNGVLRVGGQFMASADAVRRLEERIAAFDETTDDVAIGRAVDAELAKPGVAIHGVKSLTSVRDVIARALKIGSS